MYSVSQLAHATRHELRPPPPTRGSRYSLFLDNNAFVAAIATTRRSPTSDPAQPVALSAFITYLGTYE